MGRPMTRNLLKAGHQVVAYDVVPALAEARGGWRRRAKNRAPTSPRARKW